MLAPLLLAAGLQAAPPPSALGPPTSVAPVIVIAPRGEPPKLVSSYPAQGAAVAGGTTVVKLTFDQRMSAAGWSYGAAAAPAGLPRCMDRPRLLNDGHTFVILCVTTSKGSWTLRLNGPDGSNGPDGRTASRFASAGGKPLAPVDLTFTTTDDTPTTAIADAMKAASLEDDQGPIVDETAQAPTPASAVTATPASPPA